MRRNADDKKRQQTSDGETKIKTKVIVRSTVFHLTDPKNRTWQVKA